MRQGALAGQRGSRFAVTATVVAVKPVIRVVHVDRHVGTALFDLVNIAHGDMGV